MQRFVQVFSLVFFIGAFASGALGFGERAGACEAECIKCHRLSLDEASEVVRQLNPEIEVVEVGDSPVRGLWEVVIKARGRADVAYIDFSKKFLLHGKIIRVVTRENLTESKLYELNKVDVSAIPLGEALVMGNPEARFKSVVFDDPD
jgi:thiol:disulfide interchange protein DsbC